MTQHLIIRGTVNGGKTTTCGVLFEELKKTADFSKLYNISWKPIAELQYNPDGGLYDFIGIIIIGDIVIIIISQGDVARDLESILDKLLSVDFLKEITNGSSKADFIVCCARSQMRTNSTIEMLQNRIPQKQREEFWVSKKTEDDKKIIESKMHKVSEIISYIREH